MAVFYQKIDVICNNASWSQLLMPGTISLKLKVDNDLSIINLQIGKYDADNNANDDNAEGSCWQH